MAARRARASHLRTPRRGRRRRRPIWRDARDEAEAGPPALRAGDRHPVPRLLDVRDLAAADLDRAVARSAALPAARQRCTILHQSPAADSETPDFPAG